MKRIVYAFFIVLLAVSCSEDYLETKPSNQILDEVVFQSLEGVQTVVDGILRDMRYQHSTYQDQFGVKSIDLVSDLMGEDIVIERFWWFGADYQFVYQGAKDIRTGYIWTIFYRFIFNSNEIINRVDEVSAENLALGKYIKAQALSLRAYSYFQLIQLYQHTYSGHENDPGIPLYTEATAEGKPLSTVSQVYKQITDDLDLAIQFFAETNLPGRHISHPDLNVAKGLRARVALVMQDWEIAAEMASGAREGHLIMSAEEFSTGFDNYTQQNWIWGLEVNDEQSTTYASWVSHVDWSVMGHCGAGYSRKSVNSKLYNQMHNGDIRKALIDTAFIKGNYRNNKFSAGNDKGFAADLVLMRPEEMLLIEAEALARMNQETEAIALLIQLRENRIPEPVAVEATGDQLLQEILLERRIELWGEGFSLLDTKRLKKGVDRTSSNHKPAIAKTLTVPPESSLFNFQIPQNEIDSNPNISETNQNP
jgi:starch-binding outer membrane protein, SusD/RagB family